MFLTFDLFLLICNISLDSRNSTCQYVFFRRLGCINYNLKRSVDILVRNRVGEIVLNSVKWQLFFAVYIFKKVLFESNQVNFIYITMNYSTFLIQSRSKPPRPPRASTMTMNVERKKLLFE